jgi:hypothetical protein
MGTLSRWLRKHARPSAAEHTGTARRQPCASGYCYAGCVDGIFPNLTTTFPQYRCANGARLGHPFLGVCRSPHNLCGRLTRHERKIGSVITRMPIHVINGNMSVVVVPEPVLS